MLNEPAPRRATVSRVCSYILAQSHVLQAADIRALVRTTAYAWHDLHMHVLLHDGWTGRKVEWSRPAGHHADMTYSLPSDTGDSAGPAGYTYGGIVVHLAGAPAPRRCSRDDVLDVLRKLRFSGWLAQPENGWLVIVAPGAGGSVAAGRRGVLEVGGWLADQLGVPVLSFWVLDDRQLSVAAWTDGHEVGRYVSDPSHGSADSDDILPEPIGFEHAAAFAAACARPDATDALAESLSEELDVDSRVESERLAEVLRLLGLPQWLVSSASLPRDIPAGPRAVDLTRLGAGSEGMNGRLRGWSAGVVRRRRPPPPTILDPPRGAAADFDPWQF
jgi:hypothetical protein